MVLVEVCREFVGAIQNGERISNQGVVPLSG